jgi:hypothetical protein
MVAVEKKKKSASRIEKTPISPRARLTALGLA